jgi:hypothetical protein
MQVFHEQDGKLAGRVLSQDLEGRQTRPVVSNIATERLNER